MRIGMGGRAKTAVMVIAIMRTFNAADRPGPQLQARAGIANTF